MSEIIESMNWRYATKVFDSERSLSEEQLYQVLEAVRLAPSAYGLQPFRVVVVTSPEVRKELRLAAHNQRQFEECSHLLVFCTESFITEEYVKSYLDAYSEVRLIDREKLISYENHVVEVLSSLDLGEVVKWKENQTYLSLGVAISTAAMLGVDTCAIEGFERHAFDEILNLEPLGLSSTVCLALGFRHEQDPNQFLPKVRRSNQKFIMYV